MSRNNWRKYSAKCQYSFFSIFNNEICKLVSLFEIMTITPCLLCHIKTILQIYSKHTKLINQLYQSLAKYDVISKNLKDRINFEDPVPNQLYKRMHEKRNHATTILQCFHKIPSQLFGKITQDHREIISPTPNFRFFITQPFNSNFHQH